MKHNLKSKGQSVVKREKWKDVYVPNPTHFQYLFYYKLFRTLCIKFHQLGFQTVVHLCFRLFSRILEAQTTFWGVGRDDRHWAWYQDYKVDKQSSIGIFELFWFCEQLSGDVHYCEWEQFSIVCMVQFGKCFTVDLWCDGCSKLQKLAKSTPFSCRTQLKWFSFETEFARTFLVRLNWNDDTVWIVVLTHHWVQTPCFITNAVMGTKIFSLHESGQNKTADINLSKIISVDTKPLEQLSIIDIALLKQAPLPHISFAHCSRPVCFI